MSKPGPSRRLAVSGSRASMRTRTPRERRICAARCPVARVPPMINTSRPESTILFAFMYALSLQCAVAGESVRDGFGLARQVQQPRELFARGHSVNRIVAIGARDENVGRTVFSCEVN